MDPTKEYAVKKDESGAVSITRQIPPQKQEKKKNNYRLPAFIVLSLLLFLGISSTLQFKDKLFDTLFPKPPSSASEDKWKTYDDAVKEGKTNQASKILMVKLKYDEESDPKISILDVKRRNGNPSFFIESHDYQIQVLDNQNQVIYTQSFNIPREINIERFTKDGSPSGSIEKLDKVSYTLAIPSIIGEAEIKILDPKGVTIVSSDIKKVESIDNKPDFKVKRGEDYIKEKQGFNLETMFVLLTPKKVVAQSPTPLPGNNGNGAVDFTFIGDNYTSADLQPGGKFDKDVEWLMTTLLNIEPFSTRYTRIISNKVLNTQDLECAGKYCNKDKATQIVIESGAPSEQIAILYNAPLREAASGGSTGGVVSSTLMNQEYSNYTFVHETGHSLGGLTDEYNMKSFTFDKVVDKNCFKGIPPNPDPVWQQVPQNSYYSGCYYYTSDYWRSSITSLMTNDVLKSNPPPKESIEFNPVSITYLNQAIDLYSLGGTGPGGYGNVGDSCDDPIKPDGCDCPLDSSCNSGYCSKDARPWVCAQAPPGYGTTQYICPSTSLSTTVSKEFTAAAPTGPTPVSIAETIPPTTSLQAPGKVGTYLTLPVYQQSIDANLICNDGSGGSGCNFLQSPRYCIDSTNACTPDIISSKAIFTSNNDVKKYVRYGSVDFSGNRESAKSEGFIIDDNAPIVNITNPSRDFLSTNPGVKFDIQVSFADISGISYVEVWWDKGSLCSKSNLLLNTYTCSFTVPFNASQGTHTIKVTATDNALLSTDSYRLITVNVLPPNPKLALTKYVKGSDQWSTTSNSPTTQGYTLNSTEPQQGYIYSSNGPVPAYPMDLPPIVNLYDCTEGSGSSLDHITGSAFLDSCSGKSNKVTLGYIYFPNDKRADTSLLYWCTSQSGDDYTSLYSNCWDATATNRGILGRVSK